MKRLAGQNGIIPLSLPLLPNAMDFTRRLLRWYRSNRRDLPWRRTTDPYRVWLSEVILQQTRVEQGLPYFEKFVKAYPTVGHLAAAEEEHVLKLWQGLGYYSRARNLLAAARTVVNDSAGEFPRTYEEVHRLQGVGDYTAAAITSICFGLPYPVVDGNVLRFISRVYGITDPVDLTATKTRIREILLGLIDQRRPGDFNQAVMEFGATVCTPADPQCSGCVFRSSCFALKQGMVAELPVRKPGTAVKERHIHYIVITYRHRGENYLFLNRRTGNDIWKNLYDFPSLEHKLRKGEDHLSEKAFEGFLQIPVPEFLDVSGPYHHLLSHRRILAWFYRVHFNKKIILPFVVAPVNRIGQYPIPRLIERYLEQEKFFAE